MGDTVGSILGAAAGVAAVALAPVSGGASLGLYMAGAGLGMTAGSMLIDQPAAAKRASQASEARFAEQIKAQNAQRRLSEASNIRSSIAQLRSARQQRASNLVRAINIGGVDGTNIGALSPAAGAMSSASAQLSSNVGFINAAEGLGGDVFKANKAATGYGIAEAEAMQDYQMAQTIGGIGSSIFSLSGGFKTLFSKTPVVGEVPAVDNSAEFSDNYAGAQFYTGTEGSSLLKLGY